VRELAYPRVVQLPSKPHYLHRRGCAFVRLRYKRQQNARRTTSRVPSRRTCWLDAPGSQLTRGIRSQRGSAVSTARPAPARTARPPGRPHRPCTPAIDRGLSSTLTLRRRANNVACDKKLRHATNCHVSDTVRPAHPSVNVNR